MTDEAKSILNELDQLCDYDIEYQIASAQQQQQQQQQQNRTSKSSHIAEENDYRAFIRHVASVAAHPLGLNASVSPFNCTRSNILSYVGLVFAMSKKQLSELVNGRDVSDASHIGPAAKWHSWRPALRIRLKPPLSHDGAKLQRLYVRVHMYKTDKNNDEQKEQVDDAKSTARGDAAVRMLRKIFHRRKHDASLILRNQRDMRCLLKFQKSSPLQNSTTGEQAHMVQIADESVIHGDVYLHIRRYYTDETTAHTLRFEFWSQDFSWRRMFDCGASNRINNTDTFYGLIDYDLTQLPAYATKRNYAIVDLRGRAINSCEISIEPRNRRIAEEMQYKSIIINTNQDFRFRRKPSKEYLVKHLRLYLNVILYHCLSLQAAKPREFMQISSNVTLDNLVYVAAHSLINQHRLQSNINGSEDRYLRRSSLLLLLMKLDAVMLDTSIKLNSSTKQRLECAQSLVLLILQNEYTTAHRALDEKIVEEVDPFGDNIGSEISRDTIKKLELDMLKCFADNSLVMQIVGWQLKWSLLDVQLKPHEEFEAFVTYQSLKLIQSASNFYKIASRQNSTLLIGDEVKKIESSINELLGELLVRYVESNFAGHLTDEDQIEVRGSRRRRGQARAAERAHAPLTRLLRFLRRIDQDFRLCWLPNGIQGILEQDAGKIRELRLFTSNNGLAFERSLKQKINRYVDQMN